MIAFTICSNNYLAQASVLATSLKLHDPNVVFYTILVDVFNENIDYTKLPFKCIAIKEIEPAIDDLVKRYNIIELNTCIKPTVFEYLFSKHNEGQVVYFDPDIKIYAPIQEDLAEYFTSNCILITPHIFSAIPLDGKEPAENSFLNYGIYNLGFIAIKRSVESFAFLSWWKERTYLNGYMKTEQGLFVDQLYINLVPLYYQDVLIIKDKGYNMAPWNLHERTLDKKADAYLVNGEDELKFYHFSAFSFNSNELPIHYYNRYHLKERKDLQEIYGDYNKDLSAAGYYFFKSVQPVYLINHKQYIQAEAIKDRETFLNTMTFKQKIMYNIFKSFPKRLVLKIQRLINYYVRYN
jgi:hypothetical protein